MIVYCLLTLIYIFLLFKNIAARLPTNLNAPGLLGDRGVLEYAEDVWINLAHPQHIISVRTSLLPPSLTAITYHFHFSLHFPP